MQNVDVIVIASRNLGKQRRYQRVLSVYADRVFGLDEFEVPGAPDEKGETAEQNAEIKARFYARQTGCLVLAEDEALYVDFLGKSQQPGVHVRRINGIDLANDEELLAYWKTIIASVPAQARTGRWHIACCITHPNGWKGTCSLDIPIRFFHPPSPVRIPGWPLSSLQGPQAFNKPHSELSDDERKLVDQALEEALKGILDGLDG